jgi:signal transduction histidine kinase/ligand-binding sensor domain-containing protein
VCVFGLKTQPHYDILIVHRKIENRIALTGKVSMIAWNELPPFISRLLKRHSCRSYFTPPFSRACHSACIPIRYAVFTALCLLPLSNSYCQQKLLQFKHLTADDGLSSSTVICAQQDYKGFMWFGTNFGLNRYDGTTIIAYVKDPSDSGSLSNNYCKTLLEDRAKNLLIGSGAGLSQYDRDHDRFINFVDEKSSALYGMRLLINQIIEDSLGNLWLAMDEGLAYFDRIHNKFVRYRHDIHNPASISFDFVECLFIDSHNRLWVGTREGLNLFKPESGGFQHITRCMTDPSEDLSDMTILSITEDRDGTVWFGSANGLFSLEKSYRNDTVALTHYSNDPRDPHSIPQCRIKALFVDDEGRLLIGAENEGLNIFDKRHTNFIHYRIDEFNPMSLNNESINGFAQDRDRNLWLCTHKGGVNLLIKNSDFIIHYKNIPGAPQSLSYNIVSSFFEDRHARIWVGTDGGGFNLFNDTTNRFTRYYCTNPSLNRNAILCMAERSEHQIWMGTWEGGLLSYNSASNTFSSFTRHNSSIPDNSIYSIAKDTSGNLWLGSYKGGLIYYNAEKDTFVGFSTANSAIKDNRITVVRIDARGNLYLGSNNGLQVYYPRENRFAQFVKSSDTGISNNCIFDILIQNDTCIWIGTEDGLNRFNPLTGMFQKFFQKDGLPDNTIKGVALDTMGALWLSTNNGMCRYDYRHGAFKNFTPSDGLQGNEFFEATMVSTKNGAILAGGINGFNLIHPDRYSENRSIPPVVITDLQIFNKKVKVGDKGSPLQKQISASESITLSYQQSVLTFYFAVLDYTHPPKNQHAYMMENFDKGWTYCGKRHDATYTNLNPGTYRFHVKGSNNDGVWNETGTTLEIIITPPWWKTKTAWIGFGVSIICLFLSIYFYRLNQLNRQQNILKKLVEQRTHEIEEKNHILLEQTKELSEINNLMDVQQHFIHEQSKELWASNEKLSSLNETKDKLFSIIAHDLKNPFTSILGIHENLARRYDTMNDAKRKHKLETVYASSKKIYKLLETLLDWARTQTGKINFNPEEFILNELIDDTILFVENLALEKKIGITQCLKNRVIIFADKNMLTTVIRNLITNAIKFTENGTIRIEAERGADATMVRIIDSGVGINPEKTPTLFSSINTKSSFGTRGESGTGLGLIICKEFIERHGGIIVVESEVGKGSTFYFTIPHKTIP